MNPKGMTLLDEQNGNVLFCLDYQVLLEIAQCRAKLVVFDGLLCTTNKMEGRFLSN
jgi:hypothetical protein